MPNSVSTEATHPSTNRMLACHRTGISAPSWLHYVYYVIFDSAGKMNEVCTAVMESEREDCGYYGIGSEECLSNKCCWMPSEVPNTPWCFFPSGKILPKSPKNCGSG